MTTTDRESAPALADIRTRWIEQDWDELTFRVHRDAFRSEQLFAEERNKIWRKSWLYLGHATEIPEPGDYKVRNVGGVPIIFARDHDGVLHAFLNACPHRGTALARDRGGNTRFFRCFYHAWTFDNRGKLIALPGAEAYGRDDFKDRLDLREVPRMEERRGFVFVSFNEQAPTLAEHLAGAGDYLDLVADHSPDGIEVVPGTHLYAIRGNWKLAVENAMDGYHFGPTHVTFVDYLKTTGFVTNDEGRSEPLGNGHSVLVITGHGGRVGLKWEPRFGEQERIRTEENRAELEERLGAERAEVIYDSSRILFVYPNLLLFDIEGVAIRMLEPVEPGYTSVSAWQMVPGNEPPDVLEQRLKILQSFIGPGGLATPDDVEAYEAVQRGIASTEGDDRPGVDWNDVSRGMAEEKRGDPGGTLDEIVIRAFWRQWNDAVTAAEAP